MKHRDGIPMVTTIKERCRVCYTCVRECPARAIRIADGQAEVITARCIGCGNCVRVCSQGAKKVLDGVPDTWDLLRSGARVAACVAPSFPAEFQETPPPMVVGMIRALGFHYVTEVAFGADLVARRYRELLEEGPGKRYIATTCPASVGYVERYQPSLVDKLAPIVSPMVAMARAVRRLYGQDIRVVFVGPCIAKKVEAASEGVHGEVDAVLTFQELRAMLTAQEILAPGKTQPSEFDPPHPGTGALFPISRGMLQAAGIFENLLQGEVVATDGRQRFVEAIKEFESGALDARLLEILCCHGCIMGAGMTCDTPLFRRRSQVSRYVRERMAAFDRGRWEAALEQFRDLDLSRGFEPNDQRLKAPSTEDFKRIMERMGKLRPEDELNCGACGYDTCAEHAMAIYKGRAELEMCLPHTIEQLRTTVAKLATTQEALVGSERMASMGQLAAGIAHEVNNPLGILLMYAHLLLEETPVDSPHREDLRMIVEHADRCKKIVAGLLHFARQNKVEHRRTDVRDMVERLAQAIPVPPNIQVLVEHRLDSPFAEIDPDQIVQVLTNLINNAFAAMEKCGSGALRVITSGTDTHVTFEISDTGTGISEENLKRIYQPFFTTKKAGKGTGLGLAVTYGIVKMHRGDIRVESNANPAKGPTGTTFRVTLPRRKTEEQPAPNETVSERASA